MLRKMEKQFTIYTKRINQSPAFVVQNETIIHLGVKIIVAIYHT